MVGSLSHIFATLCRYKSAGPRVLWNNFLHGVHEILFKVKMPSVEAHWLGIVRPLDRALLFTHLCVGDGNMGKYKITFLRRPLFRQGRPTGMRKIGSPSSVPGAGVC